MTVRTILALIGFIALTNVLAEETVPRFEPTDCHFESEEPLEGVDCGELVVWENREDHSEGTLRLAVAILRSTADEPEPDPLVFLSGGPGSRSLYHVPRRAESGFWIPLRKKRDLVFFDQRGTGYSDPDFCDEMDRVFQTTRYLGLPPGEATARRVEAARDCREEMLAKGILCLQQRDERAGSGRPAPGAGLREVEPVGFLLRHEARADRDAGNALRHPERHPRLGVPAQRAYLGGKNCGVWPVARPRL